EPVVASFVAEAEVYLASCFQRSAKSVRRSVVMYSGAIHHRGADLVIVPVHRGGGVHIPAVGMSPCGIQAASHTGQIAMSAPTPIGMLIGMGAAELHTYDPHVFFVHSGQRVIPDG